MDLGFQSLMTNALGDGARPTACMRLLITTDGAIIQQMWQGPVGETWANLPVVFALGVTDVDVLKSGLITTAMATSKAIR